MAYIFMDESGCLGFDFSKTKTSKHFLIAFLCVERKRPLEKAVRRIFESMTPKERSRLGGALHANKASAKIRQKLLHKLCEHRGDISVMTIRLNKERVYTNLQNEKPVLYNYVTNILLDRIFSKRLLSSAGNVELIASKRETNKFLNENFKNYLKTQNKGNINLKVSIKTPPEEKCLQIADFISWALFRHYEYGDSQYYEMIKDLIVEDNTIFG